jgi:hypothetical protein
MGMISQTFQYMGMTCSVPHETLLDKINVSTAVKNQGHEMLEPVWTLWRREASLNPATLQAF